MAAPRFVLQQFDSTLILPRGRQLPQPAFHSQPGDLRFHRRLHLSQPSQFCRFLRVHPQRLVLPLPRIGRLALCCSAHILPHTFRGSRRQPLFWLLKQLLEQITPPNANLKKETSPWSGVFYFCSTLIHLELDPLSADNGRAKCLETLILSALRGDQKRRHATQ